MTHTAPPPGATAALVLADGTVLWGRGIGATGRAIGEVCFNTSMTGYQEIMTDPSYAGQIVTFTFPHIGNVGANPEDIETGTSAARGLVLRDDITEWRLVPGTSLGEIELAFIRVDDYRAPQWPDSEHPKQFHLDFEVDEIESEQRRVLDLGQVLVRVIRHDLPLRLVTRLTRFVAYET